VFLSFWDVDQVYRTPCKWKYEAMVYPGRSVNGLASALFKQPLRKPTPPTDVELDGFHGKYLELSVPMDIAFDEARREEALSRTATRRASRAGRRAAGTTTRYQHAPGQVDRLWILNVNGERLVIRRFVLRRGDGR
jgi:hypothetical protein